MALESNQSRGVWLKTHIYQDGTWLHARVYMVMAGQPEIVTVSVDLRPIAKMIRAYHNKLHQDVVSGCVGCSYEEATQKYMEHVSGCVGCDYPTQISGLFDGIAKAVKSIGKSKLVKGVAKAVSTVAKKVVAPVAKATKAVVQSKAVGLMVTAAAAVFPPVGAPALAAYAAANATLGAIDKANQIKTAATKALALVKGAVKLKGSVNAAINKKATVAAKAAATKVVTTKAPSPTTNATAKAAAAQAAAVAKAKAAASIVRTAPKVAAAVQTGNKVTQQVKAIAANPKATQALLTAKKQGYIAKKTVTSVVSTAKYSPDPAKQKEAAAAAQVLSVVAQHRAVLNQQAPQNSQVVNTGLVVDNQGRIVRGSYTQGLASKGAGYSLLLAAKGKVMPGYWTRVSGCIGCS